MDTRTDALQLRQVGVLVGEGRHEIAHLNIRQVFPWRVDGHVWGGRALSP